MQLIELKLALAGNWLNSCRLPSRTICKRCHSHCRQSRTKMSTCSTSDRHTTYDVAAGVRIDDGRSVFRFRTRQSVLYRAWPCSECDDAAARLRSASASDRHVPNAFRRVFRRTRYTNWFRCRCVGCDTGTSCRANHLIWPSIWCRSMGVGQWSEEEEGNFRWFVMSLHKKNMQTIGWALFSQKINLLFTQNVSLVKSEQHKRVWITSMDCSLFLDLISLRRSFHESNSMFR